MFILNWFNVGTSNKYEDLRKKDDDFIQKQAKSIQNWIAMHPIDSNLSQLDTNEIKGRVSCIMTDLNKIAFNLNRENITEVASHLQNLAEQSERARQAILAQCKKLKCEQNFTDGICVRIILTCPEKL